MSHEENSRGGEGTPPMGPHEDLHDKKDLHNSIEKKRKDVMSLWIAKIGDMLPEKPKKRSKNLILEKSVEYISELKESNNKLLLEKCTEVQVQEVIKLKKHIKTLEEKNAYYINLLRKAGISTEEVWDENLHRCPQKPTQDQASALLKRLENGSLPNGLSKSKKAHIQQTTSQQLAQSHHLQQNQHSAQQAIQHQQSAQQQRAVQQQPIGQHCIVQTQSQPAQINVQQQLTSQSHQAILATKKVDRPRPTPEPPEVIMEQAKLSSMATGTTTVMTQALPQIPVMSTNPAAPPSIQMAAGSGGPSLIVINDNGIPILHNVVTFQNSPIILNSASSSPLLASAATNFSESSPCGTKDMGPPPQRIASAPSVPTTGPSEVIIRPQSADTMKQVPGSSSSTITFSSTPLQPLLSPATHVLPTAASPAESTRMQLVTGGMFGFNQQQGSLYSTGPPTLPTALILPNGQIIPVVSQPSLMYPNLTWTNKISSLVKPPPPPHQQLPITRSTAPISESNYPKNISKKIHMQKKAPTSTESNAISEADRLAKIVAASTTTTTSIAEGDICKNKVPLRNIKSAPAPKKCTMNIKPQPSTTRVTTSINSSQSTTVPPVSNPEAPKSIDYSLPPPLIEPELPPTSLNRPANDILAQATESIFSPTELSPPTLTQEAHIDCSLSKEKELERQKENNDITSEKSHDLLSSITASVLSGTISSEDIIYTEAITTSRPTSEATSKDSSDVSNNKRFRPFSSSEPTQGKRPKANDDSKNSANPNNDDSIHTNIISNNSPTSNSNASSPLEKISNSGKANKHHTSLPSSLNISKSLCSNGNTSLSVTSLLSSQKDFNTSLDKIVSTEVITSSSMMLTSNVNDAYMNTREEHELPSLMLSSLTEDPSSLESGSNSGLPFLTLSPSEHFTSELSSKDLNPAPSHHSFNFGSPHCEGISMSQKEDKQMESIEINQKKKDQTPSPNNTTPLFASNNYSHPTVTTSQITSESNMLQQFSSTTVSSSSHPPMYSVANTTICNQFQSPRPSQPEESVKHESSRVSQNKACPSVPSPSTLCYNSSPLSRPPRHTPEHAEHSPCYTPQNFVQLKSPRNHLKPNSPALDKGHHLGNSPYIASSRSLEGSPSLSSYSAEALLSHQPNTTTLNNSTKTSCSQIVTTYPSSTSFPRGEAVLTRPSISYSAESLIQNQSCLDKKQQSFNYRPPLPPSYEERSQQHQCPPPTFMETSYSNHFARNNQAAPPAPNNGHFVPQPLESCRPPFSRPSCTFPPQPATSAQGYSNLSFNFSNSSSNSRTQQQHHNTSRSNTCLQNFAPSVEPHQNGCLFPNQMPPPAAPTFSDSILHHTNPNIKYDSNKTSMISANFSQPSQNHIMNNFFPSNYIPSSSSSSSHRYELGINSPSGKLDQHSQSNLNKIPSPAKPSKSNSKKSKQAAPTDSSASINVPSLPFDNSRNSSAGLAYFPVPDLSRSSRHDSFGNPRYFSSSQRLPNDQPGRMGPAPHHHRPPPPEPYNQLFKPQAPDPSLKFQATSFGMPAPSGSGGQPHVPNFNLSNIFPDISGTDAIGFSPMKFPPSLAPQSPQVMETPAPQPRSGAYHPRYPPPAPFHSHAPSFGNMIPTLNFPPH